MTTRQRILNHLKKAHRASAREIARALNLSAPNVRHHLGVLASDWRVEAGAVVKQGERGRPEKFYSLSQAALGDNLAGLVEALLSVEGSTPALPKNHRDDVSGVEGLKVESLASHILDASQFTNLPIPKRLALLVEKLNERHYQARWEAGADGPRVIFGRCPYAAVIEGHPEL
jgi:predicted ArsR family transcriptional regulator